MLHIKEQFKRIYLFKRINLQKDIEFLDDSLFI